MRCSVENVWSSVENVLISRGNVRSSVENVWSSGECVDLWGM